MIGKIVDCWRCGKLTTLTNESRCRRCNLDLSDDEMKELLRYGRESTMRILDRKRQAVESEKTN